MLILLSPTNNNVTAESSLSYQLSPTTPLQQFPRKSSLKRPETPLYTPSNVQHPFSYKPDPAKSSREIGRAVWAWLFCLDSSFGHTSPSRQNAVSKTCGQNLNTKLLQVPYHVVLACLYFLPSDFCVLPCQEALPSETMETREKYRISKETTSTVMLGSVDVTLPHCLTHALIYHACLYVIFLFAAMDTSCVPSLSRK